MNFARIGGFVAAFALAAASVGCAPPVRTVTHISAWSTDAGKYIYVAYAEDANVSRVKRCLIEEDNSLKCEDQDALNKLLNDQ